MTNENGSTGVEAYKATLRFISKLAGLAFLGYLAWLVVPKLGGFFHWVGGLDPKVLMMLVVAPVAGIVLIAGFAIYAVFFRGTGFIQNIVNSETAREAVRGRVRVEKGGVRVEARIVDGEAAPGESAPPEGGSR